MTLEEAIDIVTKETNGLSPVGGFESTNYFVFNCIVGKDGNVVYNSSRYIVNKKTGESGWFPGFNPITKWDKYINYGTERMIRDSAELFGQK